MPDCLCPLKEAATDAPNLLAYIDKQESLTFSQLDQKADSLASELYSLGVSEEDRIATFLPTSSSLIALFFAAWRLGASVCPLNLRSPPFQIQTAINRLCPKLFIDSFPIQANQLPSSPSQRRSLLLFTSGSTGHPKIALLTLENLLANARHSIPLEPKDRYLLSLPLFHVGGIGIVLRAILNKATLTLEVNDPAITHISYVPTQLYRSTPIYPNLKCLLVGGAPLPPYPPQLPIYATYGLTEMGSMVVVRKHPPRIGDTNYLGHPLAGRKVKLSPDGEILVAGDTLFQGYWTQEGIDSPTKDGWFTTGDLGKIDPQEGLAIIGRKDWQFISGGENIQPEEIEALLLQIPYILEAAVIPKKDPEYGERPIAFVKTSDSSFDLKAMRKFLGERLPKYKIPVELILLDEIPKNGLKLDRKKLQEFGPYLS